MCDGAAAAVAFRLLELGVGLVEDARGVVVLDPALGEHGTGRARHLHRLADLLMRGAALSFLALGLGHAVRIAPCGEVSVVLGIFIVLEAVRELELQRAVAVLVPVLLRCGVGGLETQRGGGLGTAGGGVLVLVVPLVVIFPAVVGAAM